jgi:hypothetical protein
MNVGRGPNDGDCKHNSRQGLVQRYAPQGTAITLPQIAVPSWLVFAGTSAETNDTYTWQQRYSLEYPVGGTIYPITWAGLSSITIPGGIVNYISDAVPVTIAAGDKYVIRDWGQAINLRPPTATLTVSGGALASTSISDPGTGLNTTQPVFGSPSAPALTAAIPAGAGAGTGGAITCIVTAGALTALNLTAGSGYTNGTYPIVFGNGANFARCSEHSNGDGAQHGTNLPDLTLTAGALAYDGLGLNAPILIQAQQITRQPAVGLIMDSIFEGSNDNLDSQSGLVGSFERSISNKLGWVSIGCSSETLLNYITRHSQQELLLGSITHLVCGLIRNDIANGSSLVTTQSRLQTIWAPYMQAGIKVYQVTCLPTTTSTDNWATTTNQTILSAGVNAIRITVNDWLRQNAVALGITVIDICSVVESSLNSGLFAAPQAGQSQTPSLTIVGGVVTICTVNSATGYPINSDIVCEVFYPEGSPGSGLAVTAHTNGSGVISSVTVNNGGTGHNAINPPWVGVPGAYSNDGVHPNAYGHFKLAKAGLFAPSQFVLPPVVVTTGEAMWGDFSTQIFPYVPPPPLGYTPPPVVVSNAPPHFVQFVYDTGLIGYKTQ